MRQRKPFIFLAIIGVAALVAFAVSPAVSQSGDPTPERRGLDEEGSPQPPPSPGDIGNNDVDGGAEGDQVILDDLIVDGSICAGFDCVNGESFGFDTLRLKENNLRIRFQDTSNSASFPTNDWQIAINDTNNGGQNKFSIDDIDGGRTPFTIEAGAPSHSLYVEDGGRVGFGTSTPVVDLHVKSGNTPTLRLEQDGTSGFSSQTWDVAGNEAGFFIRDASNGSTLPLRIRPGQPSESIDLADSGVKLLKKHIFKSTGEIGFGTLTPDVDFQFTRDDATSSVMKIENTNATAQAVQLRLQSDLANGRRILSKTADGTNQTQIIMGNDGNFLFIKGNSTVQMEITSAGDLVVTGNCSDVAGGGGCTADHVFQDGYELMTVAELAAFVAENKHLPGVPSATATQTQGLNLSQMNGALLEKIEELVLYTIQQQEAIDSLEERLAALEAKLN